MHIDDKFIKQYDSLVVKLVKKARVHGDDFDRIKAAVWLRVMESDNYDESKGKISTWLWFVGRSAIGNELKKMSRSQDALDHIDLSLEDVSNVIGDEDAGTNLDELDRIFNSSGVSERDERIVKDIYLREMTYAEAAISNGIELEAVKKVMYRAMKALREAVKPQSNQL